MSKRHIVIPVHGLRTARGYHRVLRVACAIADLARDDVVTTDHVSEALRYRLR